MQRIENAGLQVDCQLADFIEQQVLPGTDISVTQFWDGLSALIADKTPTNRDLLAQRDSFKQQLDQWFNDRKGQAHDPVAYKAFLTEIPSAETRTISRPMRRHRIVLPTRKRKKAQNAKQMA